MCREYCDALRTDINPCQDGQLCEPSSTGVPTHCTARPIACDSPADCPLFRPPNANDRQAEWACVEGFCQYPGFEYIAQ